MNADFELSDPEGGTTLVDLGCLAAQRGFAVSCYSYHLQLFDPKDAYLTRAQLLAKVREEERALSGAGQTQLRGHARDVLQALEAGNRYLIQKPTAHLLRGLLTSQVPLIVSVYGPALRDEQQRLDYASSGHSILLLRIEDETVYYQDPHYADERHVSLDHLFFAMLSRPLTGMTAYAVAIKAGR